MEKQPTEEELEAARERARADAEERVVYETSGREPDDQPGEQPLPYSAEAVQAEYARVYEKRSASCARGSCSRIDHRDDLELGQVAPVGDPLVEERGVVRLHELEAALEALVDPAVHVGEALRQHPSPLRGTFVDRASAPREPLDDHVAH
jgi:hypothetical protein